MIDAALEIWQEHGWAAVSMRGVCAQAGLIDRYFYESFADRDELLVAVWDKVRDEMFGLLLESISDVSDHPPLVQLRSAIEVLVHRLVEHPRHAQIIFGEHAGSPALEQRRQETLQRATDMLGQLARPFLRADVDENGFRMTVLMGIGGFYELISAWRAGIVRADADQIIEQAARLGETLGAQYLPGHRAE
nr:TetR/AcrR family transcriptional regulator [Haloechinothrix aidingensis]